MRNKLKNKIKKFLGRGARQLSKVGLLPNHFIMHMGGGICAQMHFYFVGSLLQSYTGSDLFFDLKWYQQKGCDDIGKFERNFDLLKIFPNLDFKKADRKFLRKLYVSLFFEYVDYFKNDAEPLQIINSFEAPSFIYGYFHYPKKYYTSYFRKLFSIDTSVLPVDNRSFLKKIEDTNQNATSCAVHVRRGDLSNYHHIYGNPSSVNYFVESFSLVRNLYPDVRFFVFSDEIDWYLENAHPLLEKYSIEVVDVNGSDRGWCDLILMSRCHVQITSQGSMGKFAAMLRTPECDEKLVVLPQNPNSQLWQQQFNNAIIIDDSVTKSDSISISNSNS